MNDNLKDKLVNGIIWSFIENFSLQIVRFIVLIILARLLLPAQFGLISMLIIFIALSRTFIDSGFGQALIQKKNTIRLFHSILK